MLVRRLASALARVAFLALPSAVLAATSVPPGDVVDQTWTLAGSPYDVTGNVAVPSGHFLHVDAGVEIHFAAGTQLAVSGDLVTSGTPASPVKLLADAGPGAPASSWSGVVVTGSATATLASTDVSSGASCLTLNSTGAVSVTGGVIRACDKAIDITGGSPTLTGVEIAESNFAIRATGSSVTTASGLHVHGNAQPGILTFSDFTLTGSLIHDNALDGVSAWCQSGSRTFTITGNTIAYNGRNGIYLYETTTNVSLTAQVHDNVVAFNTWWGIANVGGAGTVYATHDVVWGNGIGTSYGDIGLVTDKTGTMIENPLFVDGPNRDLRITSRSPAREHARDGGDIGYYDWAGALTPVLAGHLHEDLVFDAAGSPHDVVGDLTVEPGHLLTVEPGATVRFAMTDYMGGNSSATKTELRVEGTLDAAGTATQPISFVPASATHAAGDWDGIYLLPTASGSVVDHADVGWAVYGVRSEADGTNLVARSDVHDSSRNGIWAPSGATVFDGVQVHGSGSYGVVVDSGSAKLRNLVVHHNTTEGIRVNGGDPADPVQIVHSTIVSNGLYGIHARPSGSALVLDVKNSVVARHGNHGIWNEGLAGTVSATYDDVFWAASYYYGNVSAGVGSISADPGFVNEAAFDYRLQGTSPCIDAGITTSLATDAAGAPRTVDGNLSGAAEPDLGAYELQSGGNAAPTALAGSDRSVAAGTSTTFDGTGSSDADGSVVSYHWVFGDGASADGATVTHAYSSAGVYTATLTVTDDDAATGTDSLIVTVSAPDETAPGGGCGCGAGGSPSALLVLLGALLLRRRR